MSSRGSKIFLRDRERGLFFCISWIVKLMLKFYSIFVEINHYVARLHSSRMHTAHLLTVSPSMHCAGGVCSWGGVCFWGMSASGGCLLPRVGVCFWGMCLLPGGIPACPEADPPWTEFLTHATENITLPQTSFAGGKNVRPYTRGSLALLKQ